ncbi:MAG: ABC transporter permease [Micromonosporaceae bacterium]|nr:ABC transporter permease [Micromonosporaceae bacterium]
MTVVLSGARPPRASAVSASLAFGWRSLLKIRHLPEQLADAILLPVLFTVLFTYLFGGAFAGSTSRYLNFLLPGTLVMTVLLVTVYSGLGLNTDLTRGVLDRFRALPIWQPALIVGGLLGDAGRYLLSAGLVIGLGLAMGFRPDGGVVGVLLAVALILVFAFSLSWVWTTLGLLLRSPQSVTMVSFLVQFPLTFASNVFVDPATMPGWLQAFVDANPVSHLVSTERALMQGTASAGQVGGVLVAAAALVAVFAPITMYLYRRKP